jgi:uncharacterized protein YkwD
MRRLPTLVVLIALAALAGAPAANADDCQGADARPSADNTAQIAQTTLCLINAQRTAQSLSPVTEQPLLSKASAAYSALMVAQHYFGHVSPDGSELTDRLTDVGYLGQPGSWMVGENIAWGESYLATPGEIVNAWMNSPPHRANILNGDYEEIGLGIALGTPTTPNPGATYTTDFGRRRLDDAPVSQSDDELTVGDTTNVTPSAGHGTHGSSVRSGHVTVRRQPAAKARAKKHAARCARSAKRAHGKSRVAARGRCARAWSAVRKHL